MAGIPRIEKSRDSRYHISVCKNLTITNMNATTTYYLGLLMGMCCAVLLCGCTKQNLSECPEEVAIYIQPVDVEGGEITEDGVLQSLSLFVFDKDKLFLQRLDAHVGEPLRIYFPDQDQLHVVSWGNLSEKRMEIPPMTKGTPMHESFIRLLENVQPQGGKVQVKSPTTRSIALTPDDLFYSYDEISLKTGVQTSYKLKINRSVSAMAITMRNLQGYANRYDENYSLVVRDTYNAIDFYGRLTGSKVGYIPTAAFNDKKELMAPLFNLLPSHAEGVIEIDIYHGDELITTVKNDSQGQPLKAEVGKTLNVLVDFRLQVTVEVSTTPWGITHIWKEYI